MRLQPVQLSPAANKQKILTRLGMSVPSHNVRPNDIGSINDFIEPERSSRCCLQTRSRPCALDRITLHRNTCCQCIETITVCRIRRSGEHVQQQLRRHMQVCLFACFLLVPIARNQWKRPPHQYRVSTRTRRQVNTISRTSFLRPWAAALHKT